jgi:hypothetical protein
MKPFQLTCPRFVATCSTSCGCPTRACPGSNGFVADLPAYDSGTLRFEILKRVPETLIPDHRLQTGVRDAVRQLGSTLRVTQARWSAMPMIRAGFGVLFNPFQSLAIAGFEGPEGAGALRCGTLRAKWRVLPASSARAPWAQEHRTKRLPDGNGAAALEA